VSGLSSGEVLLGSVNCQGWWLVVDGDEGPGRIVAGPFADRADAVWAAGDHEPGAQPVFGYRRADGGLNRRPSPQEWSWLEHLAEQLDRLPDDWDTVISEDDPLTTLVVEVAAALVEAGLPLHDGSAPGGSAVPTGGVCLTPDPTATGILVSWRQHDRMSVDRVHGAAADAAVQHAMNRALAEVLSARGFDVDPVGGGSGHFVRSATR
jgi:hypothetical protein